MYIRLLFILSAACLPLSAAAQDAPADGTEPAFNPPTYAVYRAPEPIRIDGRLDEWDAAAWTQDFVDIVGADRPAPQLRTRAKMLWDDDALYVAAELEEPNVWASLTGRDEPIYQDDAFEVFIDPDGDSHHYYEFEINAFGTIWDLFLTAPYRDGGISISAWDMRSLQSAVSVDGTINDPGDQDEGWYVELALPWDALIEAAPGRALPAHGDQWRLNFARADWALDVVDDRYERQIAASTGRPSANWWVWAPHAAVDMHKPERFGVIEFVDAEAGGAAQTPAIDPVDHVKWALRTLYYRQQDYRDEHGRYAGSLSQLEAGELQAGGRSLTPELTATSAGYEIVVAAGGGRHVHIREDGKVWTSSARGN